VESCVCGVSKEGAGMELGGPSVDAEHGQEGRADNVVQGGGRDGGGGEIEGGEDGGGVLRHSAIDVDSDVVVAPSTARGEGNGGKDDDHDDDHDDNGNATHPTRTRGMLPSVNEGQSLGGNMVKLEVEMGGSPASRREIESWIWIVGLPPVPL
jgi:hypothetical protein